MLTLILVVLATQLPTEPPATRTIEFEEQWRTDPYSDEYLMGNVMDAAVDDDGNFYFLDTQLQEVFKFDREGNYVDTVARKGEGPGELDRNRSIVWWSPDSIVLPRLFPPKVVRLSPDGTPLEALHIYRSEDDDTEASVADLVPMGEHAMVGGSMFQFSSDGSKSISWLGVIDRIGTVLHEFAYNERELSPDPMHQLWDEAAEFWEWDRWAASEDGRIFRLPDRERWLIEQFDLKGNLVATFERDIPARTRTQEEIEELKDRRVFFFNGRKADVTYKLLDTEPPLRGLVVVDGQLWAIHNPAEGELPQDVWRRASVLSLDGELIEDVDVRIPHDPELDSVRLLRDGRLMVVENGIAAMRSEFAGFGGDAEEDEDLSDAEPAEIVIYAPKR